MSHKVLRIDREQGSQSRHPSPARSASEREQAEDERRGIAAVVCRWVRADLGPAPDAYAAASREWNAGVSSQEPSVQAGKCPNPRCVDGWVPYEPNESGAAPPIACRHPFHSPKSSVQVTDEMDGADLIAAERHRQEAEEGWTPAHDDKHDRKQLAIAAQCYINTAGDQRFISPHWPWEKEWWKPSGDRARDLVKAGALIAAEIDRLQRLSSAREGGTESDGALAQITAERDAALARVAEQSLAIKALADGMAAAIERTDRAEAALERLETDPS